MRRNGSRRAGGFTLIELLVVVAIIVLLIGILLVALGAGRNAAQKTQTHSLLAGMAGGLAVYQTEFGAYPGPFTESQICSSPNFTGSQNMYLGAGRRWAATAQEAAKFPTGYDSVSVGGSTVYVDRGLASGPQDNANPSAPVQKSLFVDAGGNAYPKPNSSGVVTPYMGMTFPLVFDKFRDALPVLYYRKTQGVDYMTGNQSRVVSDGVPGPGSAAPFYLLSNQKLTGTSGLLVKTQAALGGEFDNKLSREGLEYMASNVVGSNRVPVGGFVLISAGPDHMYGPTVMDETTRRWRFASGSEVTSSTWVKRLDDIVVSGGL